MLFSHLFAPFLSLGPPTPRQFVGYVRPWSFEGTRTGQPNLSETQLAASSKQGTSNESNLGNETDNKSTARTAESPVLTTNSFIPKRRGRFLRRITGESTSYQFPRKALQFQKEMLPENPFSDPSDFARLDPFNDAIFYSLPRLVYHMDEPAIAAITQYYKATIPPNSRILDLGASWASHYPIEFPSTMKSICALGMNSIELALNDQLINGWVVYDLNLPGAQLPYDNETFDVITSVAAIDYWIDPVHILTECGRVLRPGGKLLIAFSNRVFVQKATKMWLDAVTISEERNRRSPLAKEDGTSEAAPLQGELVNAFFHYSVDANGDPFFEPRQAFDITANVSSAPKRFSKQDPVYMIEATRRHEK